MSRQSDNSTSCLSYHALWKKSETDALWKKSENNENYGSQASILKLVLNAV